MPDRRGIAAPEDGLGNLVLATAMKVRFEKHLRDIAAMLQTSGEMIDEKYIEQWGATTRLCRALASWLSIACEV